jgi:hypothetical protein
MPLSAVQMSVVSIHHKTVSIERVEFVVSRLIPNFACRMDGRAANGRPYGDQSRSLTDADEWVVAVHLPLSKLNGCQSKP